MRRWTGWYTYWLNHRTRSLQLSRWGAKRGQWTNFRLILPAEDAGIERRNAHHRSSPEPCGHSCHKRRPCDRCWYPRPGWTIRTVHSNAGRTR